MMFWSIVMWYVIIGLICGLLVYLWGVAEDLIKLYKIKHKIPIGWEKFPWSYNNPFVIFFAAVVAMPVVNIVLLTYFGIGNLVVHFREKNQRRIQQP